MQEAHVCGMQLQAQVGCCGEPGPAAAPGSSGGKGPQGHARATGALFGQYIKTTSHLKGDLEGDSRSKRRDRLAVARAPAQLEMGF